MNLKISLRRKIFIRSATLSLFLIALIVTNHTIHVKNYHHRQMDGRYAIEIVTWAVGLERLLPSDNQEGVEKLLKSVVEIDDCVSYAFIEWRDQPDTQTLPDRVPRTILGRSASPIPNECYFQDENGENLHNFFVQIGDTEATLHISHSTDKMDSSVMSLLARVIAIAAISSLLAVLLSMMIAHWTTREVNSATAALLDSETRWEFAVDGSGLGLWDWNIQTDEVFFSKQWKKMLGFEEDEISGNPEEWDKRVHLDDKSKYYEDIHKHIEGKTEIYLNEHRVLCKNNAYKWVLDRGKVVSWTEDGKPLKMIGTHTDITERKHAEKSLKENEIKLRNIFENSTNLFYSHTTEHILTYLSPQVKDILGYTQEEAIVNWTKLTSDNPINEIGFKHTLKAIETGQRQPPYELELLHKNGKKVSVEICEAPVVINGKTVSIVGSTTDITERKQAAAALLESESMLAYAQKIAHLGHWERDLMSGETKWSDETFRIFGLDPQAFTPSFESYVERVHPDDLPLVLQHMQEFQNAEIDEVKNDIRIILPDGSTRFIQNQAQIFSDDKRNSTKLVGIILDITERKQAEDALRKSEEKYRLLTESMKDVIIRFSISGEILYVSPVIKEFGGYDPESETGSHISKYFEKKGDVIRAMELISKAVITWNSGRFEFLFKPKNKKPFPVEHTYIPISESNKVTEIQIVLRDISERKQAEEMLQKSEARNRALLNAIPDTIAVLNKDGVFLEYRPEKNARLYLPEEEYIGKSVEEILPLHIAKKSLSIIQQTLETGEVQKVSYQLQFPGEDSPRVFYSRASPCGVDQVLFLTQDITDRALMERELKVAKNAAENANRAKSLFLANMTHELRTPLNAILGYAQIFLLDKNLMIQYEKHVQAMYHSGEHLLEMINEILDFSKIEAGKMELSPVHFDLFGSLESLVEMIQVQAEQKNISFVYEAAPDLPGGVIGDNRLLHQVLVNLLCNAVKFTIAGQVLFRVNYHNEIARFTVQDTGIGVSPEKLETIFEPFFQVRGQLEEVRGTGLGLSISQKFVRLMSSELHVVLKMIGKTAVF
ncbi:MAG: hypothetical protein B6244_12135 [Candidatus Cloacimonetes bacterium 4572_55]|nr:MAG: hypothetical protein B6244_12135 [Candidatus Cloacimonetes bacterium 4572_55]